jgi:SET family sugar efflux transporter-like MFS transporter
VFWLLGAITFFAFSAHSIYFTAIPLYMVQELGAEVSVSGLLLGLTAGLEIPFMLLAARYCTRYGVTRLLRWSFISGFIFYASLQVVDSIPSLFLLTIFNGFFFGVFAGLSISLFQDALPDRPGVASAFYSNSMTIASMAGGTIAGLLAQWVDFKFALLGSVVAIVLAFIGLILYGQIEKRRTNTLID